MTSVTQWPVVLCGGRDTYKVTSRALDTGGTWNQFKQTDHLESISVENMDLNKSFAFFDIEIHS